jgi:hypothetical protein
MSGNHARGEAAGHELVSLQSAYEQALDRTQGGNPMLDGRKRAIAERLAASEDELLGVLDGAERISDEIRRIADAALARVAEMAGERALIIRSARTELFRKDAEVDALLRFAVNVRRKAGPIGFINACERQAAAMRVIDGFRDLPPAKELRLAGSLEIVETNATAGTKPARQRRAPIPFTPSPIKVEEEVALDSSRTFEADPESPPAPGLQSTLLTASMRRGAEAAGTPIALSSLARHKEKRYRSKGIEVNVAPFGGSAILKSADQAAALYFCCPFHGQPRTHLLFSCARDGKSIAKCHELIDNVGITLVVVQAGPTVFGGFAASKWRTDARPFGNGRNSFLFNLTRDAVVPFRPQAPDACHLFATPDSLTFGRRDLVLAGDFAKCSSALENSYGVGFEPNGTDAQTFLAGKHEFAADAVEVWGFFCARGREFQ